MTVPIACYNSSSSTFQLIAKPPVPLISYSSSIKTRFLSPSFKKSHPFSLQHGSNVGTYFCSPLIVSATSSSSAPLSIDPGRCRSEGLNFLKSLPVTKRKFAAIKEEIYVDKEFCEGGKKTSSAKKAKSKKPSSTEIVYPSSSETSSDNNTMSAEPSASTKTKKGPSAMELIARKRRKLQVNPPSDETPSKGDRPPLQTMKSPASSNVTPSIQSSETVLKVHPLLGGDGLGRTQTVNEATALLLPAARAKYEGGKEGAAMDDSCFLNLQAFQVALINRERERQREKTLTALAKERDTLAERMKLTGEELEQTRSSVNKEKASNAALTEENRALKEKLVEAATFFSLKARMELVEEMENDPSLKLVSADMRKDLEELFPDGDPLADFAQDGGDCSANSSTSPRGKTNEGEEEKDDGN